MRRKKKQYSAKTLNEIKNQEKSKGLEEAILMSLMIVDEDCEFTDDMNEEIIHKAENADAYIIRDVPRLRALNEKLKAARKVPPADVGQPRSQFSDKQMKKFKLAWKRKGFEEGLLIMLMVLTQDYDFGDEQVDAFLKRACLGEHFIHIGAVDIKDVADIIKNHSGTQFDIFINK